MNSPEIRKSIDAIYQQDSRRVFASLVRLLGDFDLAEDALHEAFKSAVEQWPKDGLPANPVAWLVSAGRFKAIDSIRRQSRFGSFDEHTEQLLVTDDQNYELGAIEDERLRLIFTCCHPSISSDAQIALTLREVCGLTTEEIASAFLTPAPTIAQRIVRAKSKIKEAKIPYVVPEAVDLPDRLQSVLRIVYLVFNEGYSASSGSSQHRLDLTSEAIRLARLIANLLNDPEVNGLLSMMLLHESRRTARSTANGDIIPLNEQDRNLWDQALIQEGLFLVNQSLQSNRIGSYTLQAAISSVHASAASFGDTDWAMIVRHYEALYSIEPNSIVELNLAVAIGMRDGPSAGIQRVESILSRGELQLYHLAHATRADLYQRLGNLSQARNSYQTALALAKQEPEIRFLTAKLSKLAADVD